MKQLTKPFTRLNPVQWQHIIDRQMASGLSQKAFCQTQNISLSTFKNWKRKLRIDVPILIIKPPESLNWQLEFELSDGVIFRIRR
ncbi:IS66 family insertion sequence element accessory protein TnpA [Endozoicomonas sp. 8E]|uniref:IS66 family insertion sequence element accessory protein TnpA n=1 Tax=Endozoicomonas sp. 8E TaxID=3035692 RepID=UPI0029394927|nr:hypothetical protein [Endozoicomonas sp. 8E]WOG26218.1 hypothetical protein P6910_16830 [Endozoicomonas sp. 8E]